MIAFIILFFVLITFDFNISKFTKRNVTFFPIILSLIVFILYVFGLFDKLTLGLYLIYFLTTLNFIYLAFNLKNHKINFESLIRPRYIALGLYLTFIFYVNHGNKLLSYDEFSAWGLYIKNTFDYNSLHIFSPNPIAAKAYFPGTTLFIYFLLKLKGSISEELMINGLNIIYFALISTLFDKISKRNIFEFLKIFLLILLIPLSVNMWPTPTSVILTDALLGCVFAYCLYFYYTNQFGKYYIINLSFALFLLNSIKTTGMVFSFLFLFIALIDTVFFRHYEFKKQFAMLKKHKVSRMFYLLLPMLMLSFSFISWSFILKRLSLKNVVPTSFNFSNDYFFQSLQACFTTIFAQSKSYFFSFLPIFIGVFIYLKDKVLKKKKLNKNIKRFIVFISLYVFSGIVYSIFLTTIVVTQMPKELALRAEGLVRYLCTYILATNMLFSCFFIYFQRNKKIWLFSASGLLLIIFIQFTLSPRFLINLIKRRHVYEANVYRVDYEKIKQISNFVDEERDVVYFVGVNQIDILIANYNVYPISLSSFVFKVEKKSKDNILILQDNHSFKPPFVSWKPQSNAEKEKVKKLNGKLWLYVFRFSDEFKDLFGEFFVEGPSSIKNDTLYSVENNNGRFTFDLLKDN